MDNSAVMKQMLDSAMKEHPEDFKDFDTTKNVQDQLQEMMGGNIANQWKGLIEFAGYVRDEYEWIKPEFEEYSWEQLWLAFVMKERWNKIWTGETWVEVWDNKLENWDGERWT